MTFRTFAMFAAALVLGGCGGDDSNDATVDGGGLDSGPGGDAGGGCERTPRPADGPRFVVVSHPNTETGPDFEVLAMAADGTLSRPGTRFSMGRAPFSPIRFTPDGAVGLVAQDDGSVGVFTLDASGIPTVVEEALTGDFYAAEIWMEPGGGAAWVIDAQWRTNGGGLYRLTIDCDGTVSTTDTYVASKLPKAIHDLGDGRALVPASDILDSPTDKDLHLVDWPSPTGATSSVDVFPDDDAIVIASAVTRDGGFALLVDNSVIGTPRVGVAGIDGNTLSAVQVVSGIDDPFDVVTSPFDNTAVVVSGEGNDLVPLAFDGGNLGAPYTATTMSYVGAPPQLPGKVVMIERGSLEGLVLVPEVSAVRRFQFGSGGEVTDLGAFELGDGFDNIVGAVGVQP